MKKVLIRRGARGAPAILALLATLRLLAMPQGAKEPDTMPLEVTYYFLPG